MAKQLKHLSLATAYEVDNSFDSEKFIKMRLRVCHDGVNPNGSKFNVNTMERADSSLANTPVLANVVFDLNDQPQFGSHDVEIEVDKTDNEKAKLIYKEQPIGVVPESNNSEIKEYNNKNYVYCDCFIWRGYSNYAEDVINRDKNIKLSMEIVVNDYKYDSRTKSYEILDYTYTGITFLGNDKGTGMKDALATTEIFEGSTDKDNIVFMMSELKDELTKYQLSQKDKDITKSVKKEDDNLFNEEIRDGILAKFSLTIEDLNFEIDEDMTEEKFETMVKTIASAKNVSYESTYLQKRTALVKACDGTSVENVYFYLVDFDDSRIYVEKADFSKDEYEISVGRFSYIYDETTMSAELTSEFELMVVKWLTIEENEKLEESRRVFEQTVSDFEEYKTKYSTPETDVEELRQFKYDTQKKIHEAEIDNIITEFEDLAKDEEFISIKEKAYSFENVETLKKELYAIRGKRASFAKETENKGFVKIPYSAISVEEDDKYGGILYKKYKN